MQTREQILRDDIIVNGLISAYQSGKYQIVDIEDKFKYSLQQNAVSQTDDIYKILTDFRLTVFRAGSSATSRVYTLKPNETLQFSAPNLIDLRTYSNYVKYEYINTNDPTASLPVNTDCKLGQYESLILYWKTADDADVHYQYAKFGSGAIIKPTFTVYTTDTTYGSTLPLGQGVVLDDALNTHIADDVTSILTGNRQISNRAINMVTLHSDFNYCYWVRNSKVRVGDTYKYALFDDGEDTYMLQSGEYFIYTDSSFSSLNIVGAGTMLTRNRLAGQGSDPLYVDCISYSDILSEGLSAISYDTWYSFKGSEMTITLVEMQLLNLSEGCTITFTRTDTSKDMIIYNAGTSGAGDLSDYTITYTVPNDTEIYSLPAVVDESIRWSVRGLLTLDLSDTNAQLLQGTVANTDTSAQQQITLYYAGDQAVSIPADLSTTAAYSYSMLANKELFSSGLTMIDTTTITDEGKTEYLSMYVYTLSTVTNPEQITYLDDQSVVFRFNDAVGVSTAPTIAFKLPALPIYDEHGVNFYVLKVVNPNTDCTITIETNASSEMDDAPDIFGETQITAKGVYYYILASVDDSATEEATQLSITIPSKSTSEWDTVTFAPIAKCHLRFSEYLADESGAQTTEALIGRQKATYIHAVFNRMPNAQSRLRGKFAFLFTEPEGQSYDLFDPLSYFTEFNPKSRFVIPRLKDININIVNKE